MKHRAMVVAGLGLLVLACGGPTVGEVERVEVPQAVEDLPPCDPGEDWSEATIASWLAVVSEFEGEQGQQLVFMTLSAGTLDGADIEFMVMAEGDRELGSFVRVFADPPVNAVLKPDGEGSSILSMEGHGAFTPVRCSR